MKKFLSIFYFLIFFTNNIFGMQNSLNIEEKILKLDNKFCVNIVIENFQNSKNYYIQFFDLRNENHSIANLNLNLYITDFKPIDNLNDLKNFKPKLPSAYLNDFWVNEKYRMQGLGKRIFDFMIEICSNEKIESIVWIAAPFDIQDKGKQNRKNLIKWYIKNGAKILCKSKDSIYMFYKINNLKSRL